MTEKDILKKIDDRKPAAARFKKLQWYYEGKHKILTDKDGGDKIVNDFPGYIVDTVQGYLVSKPLTYSAKNGAEEHLDRLKNIFDDNNEPDHNAELIQNMSICGEAYELIYTNENGDIRFCRIPEDELIPVFEETFDRALNYAIRKFKASAQTFVDFYDKEKIVHYEKKGNRLIQLEEETHFFGRVPVVYYHNNDRRMGDFEKQLPLIDAYNQRISESVDEMQALREAYLKILNASGTDEEDLELMKRLGVIFIEGDGDASFITKNINDAFIENNLKRIEKNIHKFAKVPDLSDENFSGDISGIAIEFKLSGLEFLAATKERKLYTGIRRRIKLITEILNIQGGNYDWRDIGITFHRNKPRNDKETADMVSGLHGLVSNETLIKQLSFVDDVSLEFEQLAEQEKDGLDYGIFAAPKNEL